MKLNRYSSPIAICRLAALITASIALTAGTGYGAIILNENFDSYTPGTSMGDHGWTLSGSGNATVQTAPNVPAGMDFGNSLVTQAGPSVTSSTAYYNFSATTGHVSVSVDAYMGTHTGNIYIGSGATNVAQVHFRLDPREIRVYHADAAENGYSNLASTFPYGRWYRVEFDFYLDEVTPANSRYDVSIYNLTDNLLVGSLTDLQLMANAGSISRITLQSAFSNASTHSWDNILITAVPEPGAVGAFVGILALIGAGFYRHRRAHRPSN